MEPAVQTRSLRKSYGATPVLHDLSLAVPRGSIFGFLGPNGAGKSTTIRILLGLLRASGGAALVLGADAWSQGPQVRWRVGYLPGDVRFYDGMTGAATLDFFNAARGGSHQAEIDRLAGVFELDLKKKVRTYSRGNKQKLGLIQALFHRPALVILDEPTTALDPLVRLALDAELRRARDDGQTILFSSHTLSEVEEICDRVAILREGRLIEENTIDALRNRAVRHVQLTESADRPLAPPPPTLRDICRTGRRLTGAWHGRADELLAWLTSGSVSDVVISPPGLEELFRAYYSSAGGAGA